MTTSPGPFYETNTTPAPSGLKLDREKLPYHLVDEDAEAEMVAVLGFGAVKYDPGNWRHVHEAEDRYYSAIRRHLRAARRGEVLDAETGLLALAGVACSAHFLLALALKARPDLVASLPERYRRALEVAHELRERRLREADARSLRDLAPEAGATWTWRVTARGSQNRPPSVSSGISPSREEAKETAEREAAALAARGVSSKIHITQSEPEKPRAARKRTTAKKTSGRRR